MDMGSRTVVTPRTGVVAGSVWESRMKVDEVQGGIKVFSGDDKPEDDGEKSKPKQGLVGIGGKRKTWKTETSEGCDKSPIQIARQGSELAKNLDEECKDLSLSGDEIKKSPIQISRQRSELSKNLDEECNDLSLSVDEIKKSSNQISRQRSELSKNLDDQCKELSVSADGIKRSPVQKARKRSEWSKNLDKQCKELSLSADGIKKSPIQTRKTRSEVNRELNLSVDGMGRSPIRSVRTRSVSQKGSTERNSDKMERNSISNDSSDGNESNAELKKVESEANITLDESFDGNGMSSIQLRKAKSDSNKVLDESSGNLTSLADTIGKNSVELRKAKFESNELVDESRKVLEGSAQGIKKNPTGITKTRSDENCKEFGECEEKVITSNLDNNVSQVKSPPKLQLTYEDDIDNDCGEEYWDGEYEEEVDEEIEIETEKKSIDIKEISIPELKAKKIMMEEKKIHQSNVKSVPISTTVKKQPNPVVNTPRIIPKPTKTKPNEYQSVPKTHSKLQSLVDLVMWRDASKSAFIFGFGTFIIISSSFATDINISLISILSYLGLVYLAAIFLFRSIISRGAIYVDDTSQEHVVGEEEAVWLLKLILPYINEFLLKLRALFSGDPATTMKLAMLLFVLAQCGSSITIWKMAKLGFFGVFTVPKICSSYSSQLTAYGKFWIQRFRDAWESCSHKKGVGFFIFTVVWNLSSIVARIWAVFMLFVAFRYYQQKYSMMNEEDLIEEEARGGGGGSVKLKIGGQRRQGRGPTVVEIRKQKKGSFITE